MATEKENIEPEYRLRTIESLSRHIESALRYQHTATNRTSYTLHRVFKCFNLRYYESYVTGLYLATKIMYVGNVLTNLLLVNKFLETDEYSVYGFGVLKDLLFGRSWMDSGNFPRVTLCDFEVRVLGNNQRHSVQCVLVINIFNEVDGVLILRMVALHAGVMYCTEITDALWRRYLSQHPENLIEEDSALINFARTQSVRRTRRTSGESAGGPGPLSGSLQPNHNGSHQRLSRFLSHHTGSFRLHRGKQSSSRSLSKQQSGPSRSQSPGESHSSGGGPLSAPPTGIAPTVIQITPSSRPSSRAGFHAQLSSIDSNPQSPTTAITSSEGVIQITPSSRPSSRAGFHAQLSSIDSNPQSPTTAITSSEGGGGGGGIAHRGSGKAAAAFRSIKSSSKGSASDSPVLL
uniref:Innexin n=1 Tax=Panagrolaimus sp. ES5 TaxID=591445 RepID=A0AC34F5J9_9BILA